ncbi:hypothetical protein WI372_11465 [Gemmatimonadota bacterium DH-20]|uniref:Outer membrane beta-barrel protein n=1 Tax=Gaopeijia maritima TaxID=3119007 RepID=A0ABU9EA32_9BACT
MIPVLSHLHRALAGRVHTAALVAVFALPVAASGQLGAIEGLASRVSDLGFYATFGTVGDGGPIESDAFGVASYGLEVLFEVGAIEREVGVREPSVDSVQIEWVGMVVERSGRRADTTWTYEVVPAPEPAPRMETLWTFELGLGYGEISGYRASEPGIDLRGVVRELPSISLYASYAPLGFYAGLRSGFMRLQGLQLYLDDDSSPITGDADSFLAGVLVGQVVEVLGLDFFVEGAWTVRDFHSVEWSAPPPASLRSIDLTGWSVGTGVQFSVGG